jgi:radical SAM superfamily enzyme YgiQ (UPF0313 family)
MKILFVNPNSKFLINDKVFPNLGLLYLSAYLKENGYNNVRLIDLNGGNILPEIVDADIVGLYSTTPQFLQTLRLVKKLKNINRVRDALYVIGGPHVSGKPQDAFKDFDIIVMGEGERALLDIVRRKELNYSFKEKVIRYEYEKISINSLFQIEN